MRQLTFGYSFVRWLLEGLGVQVSKTKISFISLFEMFPYIPSTGFSVSVAAIQVHRSVS